LAYVVKGYAGPDLLETYTQERAPIGKQVVERANQSRLDYKPLNECFRDRSDPDPVAAGIRLLKSPGVEGQRRRAALRVALELKNDEFNAQGIEMNQRYHSSAVIEDPQDGEEVWRHDPKQYLQATTRPGAKLPHAWLVDSNGLRVSTLDVVGKGLFSLVTGMGGLHWVEAVESMALPFLRPVVIGAPGSADAYGNWTLVSEVEETAAILVRPDGYVAWRHKSAPASKEDARLLLQAAMSSLLSAQGKA
jgi:2,4-dichlorophenol 6-monooxygenase